MLVKCWRANGWFLSILLGGEGSSEWSFFQQRTKLQTSTLSYECDQSTSHVLVCKGLRSRISALLTQLNLWALGHVQSTIQTRADSIHQLLVDWCSKILTVAFFQLLTGHQLQCSVWYAKKTWHVTLVK